MHVCNVVVDGVIDSANTRNWMGIKTEEGKEANEEVVNSKLMNCEEICREYLNMYNEGKTAWSYEIMLRPSWSSGTVGMRM